MGAVFAEKFNRTNRDLLRKPVFEKGDGYWLDILPTVTKEIINRVYSSSKLSPIQAFLKMNEGFVYQKLLDKRKEIKPKIKIYAIARKVHLIKTFSKRDTTKWPYIL